MTYFPGILADGSLAPGLAATTVCNSLGLGTADSPTFAGVTIDGEILVPVSGYFRGNNTTGFRFNNAANSINLFIIRDDGNIGVGRLPAFGKFHIKQTISTNLSGLAVEAVVNDSFLSLHNDGSQFVIGPIFQNTGVFQDLVIRTSGLNRMRFATSGLITVDSHITGPSGITQFRNGNTAQKLRISKNWVSDTSFQQFEIDTTQTGFLDIVAYRGSLGGAENGIRIGSKADGASIVPWLSFTNTGVAAFSGAINPRAGTAAAGTSPIKLTSGPVQTTPEAGAIEYDGTNLYFTDSGGTRRTLAVV